MRRFVPLSLGLLILPGALAATSDAPREGGPGRWLPAACTLALDLDEPAAAGEATPRGDDGRWNHFYRRGIDAIANRDLAAAELAFCRALAAAGSFGPRDIRFAETLDELGLARYLSGDDEGAEAMQGAAVAEMLLTLGPPTEDLVTAAEKSCDSSLATYMVRLGWIFERQGRAHEIEPLLRAPHLILARGYIPDASLRPRLDWLIGRYLLGEEFAVADWLSSLRDGDVAR